MSRGSGTGVVEVAGPASVPVVATVALRNRVRHPLLVQLVRYAAVGTAATAVNAVVYLALRTGWDAGSANLAALLLSTAVSTEANRRFTFGGATAPPWRAHMQNGGTVAFYAFYSSGVLLLFGWLVDDPTAAQETLAVAVASALGGTVRFLVLRQWVFARRG